MQEIGEMWCQEKCNGGADADTWSTSTCVFFARVHKSIWLTTASLSSIQLAGLIPTNTTTQVTCSSIYKRWCLPISTWSMLLTKIFNKGSSFDSSIQFSLLDSVHLLFQVVQKNFTNSNCRCWNWALSSPEACIYHCQHMNGLKKSTQCMYFKQNRLSGIERHAYLALMRGVNQDISSSKILYHKKCIVTQNAASNVLVLQSASLLWEQNVVLHGWNPPSTEFHRTVLRARRLFRDHRGFAEAEKLNLGQTSALPSQMTKLSQKRLHFWSTCATETMASSIPEIAMMQLQSIRKMHRLFMGERTWSRDNWPWSVYFK